ncbi:hypothetical protein IGI04_026757, partial [Brassica rapa subsp. trilocularis]
FDGLAKLLDENLLSRDEEPEVVVATNINPKLIGSNMPAILEYEIRGRLNLQPEEVCGVKKIERLTLAKLQHGFTSFTCFQCNEENVVGVIR